MSSLAVDWRTSGAIWTKARSFKWTNKVGCFVKAEVLEARGRRAEETNAEGAAGGEEAEEQDARFGKGCTFGTKSVEMLVFRVAAQAIQVEHAEDAAERQEVAPRVVRCLFREMT